jgi:hypothetical protein
MLIARLMLVCCLLVVTGCGSKPLPPPAPAEPSLADQLIAAKELVKVANEKYDEALALERQYEDLVARLSESTTDEEAAHREERLKRIRNRRREAERELDNAKRKVRDLAERITIDP